MQIVWESTRIRCLGRRWGVPMYGHHNRAFVPQKFGLMRRRTGRERDLGLTPSAVYMLNVWIKPILRNTSNGWACLNIAEFAGRPHSPSLRACREAYNRLYAVQEELGLRFIHNHDKVPQIYVSHTAWLDANPDSDGLPLFFKRDNQRRHIRARHEQTNLPLSVNAQLYEDRIRRRPLPKKKHDADSALILYPSVSQKQTEKAFQSSPSIETGFATENVDEKLAGWIRSRCKEALPDSYGFRWSTKGRGMVGGYVRKALAAAHDKDDIIDAFISAAELLRKSRARGDAGLVAIKASELIKTYTSRGSSPQARLASFALRRKVENLSAAQADANEILRHLLSFEKTKIYDHTILSFLTLTVFKDPPAKLYLFEHTLPQQRRFLYKLHCHIQRDLLLQSRFKQQSLNLIAA